MLQEKVNRIEIQLQDSRYVKKAYYFFQQIDKLLKLAKKNNLIDLI